MRHAPRRACRAGGSPRAAAAEVGVDGVPDGGRDAEEDGEDDEVDDGGEEPLPELKVPDLGLGLGVQHEVFAKDKQVDGGVEAKHPNDLSQEDAKGAQVAFLNERKKDTIIDRRIQSKIIKSKPKVFFVFT